MSRYISINENGFGFKDDSINEILDTDIKVSDAIYNKFFEQQSQGKQLKIKNINGITFEDMFEEHIPEPIKAPANRMELLKISLEKLNKQREEDKIQTQLAIAELASSLLGGE